MTRLSTIFAKPINRHIEGVIKADDDTGLQQEVEEYVLTNEVAKRLENFLYAYNDYQGANGVWISGFFGSGKSHLLKILALLLENRPVNDTPILDLFLSKCGDNEILRGDLKRAVAIPSRSILFNIDQKADVISKTQIDALLAVFVKVFDETCGYYGKQGHIAQFERDLDKRGQYAAFKEAYAQIAGIPWERGREQALLEGANIAAAYAQAATASPAEAEGILDKYRAQYRVSIEDFAQQVNDYISRQGPDFRLNFFVDEVGQYIADNIKLMTNLQTIAESLATKCHGRSWIIITAQEDMNTVVGEMGQQQSQDFSKIQARFATRMKLTSADVAEVIQKRLLLKNEAGIQRLTAVYAQQHNNFKTLFDFADGAQTYRNFRDRDHFIHSYPFVPYQFPLFQAAIQSLSLHNAFEGKHSSVGERSMLGVFQQVAVQIADHTVGQLATFDLMFEGIRTALLSGTHAGIRVAEANLDNQFAVRVLKALFLVKYVKEFRATARNLAVLLLPHFDTDLPDLRRRLEEALDLLEQQTYIQRNGDLYEYLTDEEKDVEKEIKHTEVESSDVAAELGKLIFDHVIKERKIRYEENGQDYAFARKLDDRLLGQTHELAIHVISPFHEHTGNETVLRAQAMGRDELLVILPSSDRLLRDLTLYKQTDKYVLQNISITQKESTRLILTEKQLQNRERYESLRQMVRDLLLEAKLIAGGQELDSNGSDAQTRLLRGFQELVARTYPNLRMLPGIPYKEEDIGRYLQPEATLLGDNVATFGEAEQEMLAYINSEQRSGLRITLQSLVNRFERKPYGWYLAAIQCTLARLCGRGKVELRQDSTPLENAALEQAIRNTRGYGNVILSPQIEFSPGQIGQLRQFHAEFFDGPPLANEAKALGQETARAFADLAQTLADLRRQAAAYPFLTALDEPLETLQKVTGQPYTFYLSDLRPFEDTLFDQKESIIDPIRRFMSGAQQGIYDDARRFLDAQDANFSYVGREEAQALAAILDDPRCYQGNKMQEAKRLLDGLQQQVTAQVAAEREQAVAKLNERWQRLTGMAEFDDLTADQQAQLQQPFTNLQERLSGQSLIAVIRDLVNQFDTGDYPRQLHRMTAWAAANTAPPPVETPPGETPKVIAEPRIEYVAQQTLRPSFAKAWLANEEDIDAYLDLLKQKMLAAIKEGKRIQV
jgi:hypothetical protein